MSRYSEKHRRVAADCQAPHHTTHLICEQVDRTMTLVRVPGGLAWWCKHCTEVPHTREDRR